MTRLRSILKLLVLQRESIMLMTFVKRVCLVSSGIGMAFLLVGCAVTPPKAANFVLPPIGTTWILSRSDSGSFGSTTTQITTTRGVQQWQGVRLHSFESPGFTSLLNDSGGVTAFLNGDKPIVSFEPPLGFAYPLEVGKTLTSDHKVTLYPAMRVVPMQVIQTVEAYEDVTVPAGTFKTYRIRWIESNGNDNTYWINPDTGITVKSVLSRTEKSSSGMGVRRNEMLSQNGPN